MEHYSKEVLAHKPKEVDTNDMTRIFNAWVKINSWTPEEFNETCVRRAAIMTLSKSFEISELRKKEKQLREEDEKLDLEAERERLIIGGLLGGDKGNEWYRLTETTKPSVGKIRDIRMEEDKRKETERLRVLKETITMEVLTKQRAPEDKGHVIEETATSSGEIVVEARKESMAAKQDNSAITQFMTAEQNKFSELSSSTENEAATKPPHEDTKDNTKEPATQAKTKQTADEQKPNIKQPRREEPITVTNVTVTLPERLPSNAPPP